MSKIREIGSKGAWRILFLALFSAIGLYACGSSEDPVVAMQAPAAGSSTAGTTTPIGGFSDPGNGNTTITVANNFNQGDIIVLNNTGSTALNGQQTVVNPTPNSFQVPVPFDPTIPPPSPTNPPTVTQPAGPVAGCATTGATTAITLGGVPSRVSGVAPLAVFFDASSTTATATTRPFHDLEYRWDFGDTAAALPVAPFWNNGTRPGVSSRSTATGPVAGHVFEVPGTYTLSLSVTDGTNSVSNNCLQIVVADPTTIYSGNKTVCIANSTATAGSGGCPAGSSTPPGTTAFDTALAACIGASKRCLFKKGDVFSSSTTGNISNAGPLTIGAYGSGSLPIVNSTQQGVITLASNSVSDLRIMDLNIVGSATNSGICISVNSMASSVLVLRLTCQNIGKGIIIATGSNITGSIIQDSNIFNIASSSGGVGIFGWAINSAFLGNLVGPFLAPAEHNIRLQPGQKVAISNNTLTTPGTAGKQLLTIRALEHTPDAIDPNTYSAPDTQYVYISDNKLISGGSSIQMFQVAPASVGQNNWISDVVAERNWLVFGSVGSQGIYSEAVRLTVRNNICDTTGGVFRVCYGVSPGDTTGGVPTPDDNRFYNNTCFAGDAYSQFFCVALDAGAKAITNSVVKNNLSYGPLTTQAKMLFSSGAVTGTIGASGTFGNSSDSQITNTNPLWANGSGLFNTPSDFQPTGASYAIGANNACGGAPCSVSTAVPVWSDFFRAGEPSPYDMGAVNH